MSLKVIEPNKAIQDAIYLEDFEFACGRKVPMYQVNSIYALTQIIGYVKYINASYGNVLYRGQCKLYKTIEPSIYHGIESTGARSRRNHLLNLVIDRAINDKDFSHFMNLDNSSISRTRLESVLQHYGIPTHYVDVVDNHWTALWFGANKYTAYLRNSFCKYEKRSVDMGAVLQKRMELSEPEFDAYLETIKESMYQYLLLIAVSKSETASDNGIKIGDDTISVDLKSTLPSTFLRPHAQHGWTIKRKSLDSEHGLDMANNVVGILRIRVCDAFNWVGNGELLSQESLFPNPHFDQGYNVLLNHKEFFKGTDWRIPVVV